ncbi:carboxylic acid reductase [Nocardia sp. 004]|uniref:carboxylic acid reductase n=1 Tax=Nocardia sp. 004 TaxID=3385978 RepID=UPI0039A3206E
MQTETRTEHLVDRIAELYAEYDDIRKAAPRAEIVEQIHQPDLRLAQVIETAMIGYADRPALGQRATELRIDEKTGRARLTPLPKYHTITYGQLWERVRTVAAAWHGAADNPLRTGDFVAMLGFISSDYVTLDLACASLGLVSVPLQSSAPRAQLNAIVAETTPQLLAATPELLDAAVECVLSVPVRRLLVFDYHPDDDDQRAAFDAARERLAAAGSPVLVETFDELLARGSGLPPAPLYIAEPDEDPLALLIYTSGSTGKPKGAMHPERLVTAGWQSGLVEWLNQPEVPAICLGYLPMSHIAGRMSLTSALARGGTMYLAAKSDMSTLFEDIALVRPTELLLVPRVCDMVFQRFQSEMSRRSGPGVDQVTLETDVRTELREHFLGGRCATVLCGSAPLSAEMKSFMESVLELELHDGYGSTEAGGGIMVDNQLKRPPVLDYKLVDVPELGYFRTDRPHPRGELLVKSTRIFPGYYKRPEATAEVFDPDGFYRTGDIVAELEPDRLVYVDRRNNVLKLSQGEFVAVAQLEAMYATSPLVRQIFVYGSSERAYLLAVIVPTAAAWAGRTSTEVKAALSESLHQLAEEAGLRPYEIPRDFLIETEPFSTGNGLLSGIGKLLRPKLKERYEPRLQQLYAELAAEQVNELRHLHRIAADRPVLETVSRAATSLLGHPGTELRPEVHFTDLGGDSLSALSLSNLLHELFDVEVPVSVLISPANNLRDVADYIAAERTSGRQRATFTAVHDDSAQIRATDLTLDKFLDASLLAAAPTLPSATTARTVLLTGANGYLGRFLCLEWLQRLHETGGTLICLIRGTDATVARQRLAAVFDSGDPMLIQRFQKLAAEHLEVISGDIEEQELGLDEAVWDRLAERVDMIVHPAALVNHVLPYRQLFGPNVVGTAELIRLAVTTRLKPFVYLSTVGVAAGVDPSVFTEDGDIREISPVRAIDDSYANGYGNSKWAGEVLLREANELCGLPVAVFRSDMILADSRYTGQLNVPDMFTRLLLSLLATGIAPFSFYPTDADGNRVRAHYDGLPVDFTAAAITTVGAAAANSTKSASYQSFDVLNPHDDGRSLDEFVDWLIAAGYQIERITDYDQWFARFETALRALPLEQRRASLLPLLHGFRHPLPAVRGSVLPTEKFRSAVRAAKIGVDQDIPRISRELIEKYATDLKALGLL